MCTTCNFILKVYCVKGLLKVGTRCKVPLIYLTLNLIHRSPQDTTQISIVLVLTYLELFGLKFTREVLHGRTDLRKYPFWGHKSRCCLYFWKLYKYSPWLIILSDNIRTRMFYLYYIKSTKTLSKMSFAFFTL